jgi:hypothetical protein
MGCLVSQPCDTAAVAVNAGCSGVQGLEYRSVNKRSMHPAPTQTCTMHVADAAAAAQTASARQITRLQEEQARLQAVVNGVRRQPAWRGAVGER